MKVCYVSSETINKSVKIDRICDLSIFVLSAQVVKLGGRKGESYRVEIPLSKMIKTFPSEINHVCPQEFTHCELWP